MNSRRISFLLVVAVGLLSCSKSSSSPSTPPAQTETPTTDPAPAGDPAAAATEPGAPGVPWAQKDFKQRQEWMGIKVMPEMKALFKGHDANAFGTFKCQTCHGDDMKEKNFEMPNAGIYPLDKKDPIGAAMAYDEKITKFMMEQVTPQMAKLLDMEPYNPQTGQGFGCFNCHPTE